MRSPKLPLTLPLLGHAFLSRAIGVGAWDVAFIYVAPDTPAPQAESSGQDPYQASLRSGQCRPVRNPAGGAHETQNAREGHNESGGQYTRP